MKSTPAVKLSEKAWVKKFNQKFPMLAPVENSKLGKWIDGERSRVKTSLGKNVLYDPDTDTWSYFHPHIRDINGIANTLDELVYSLIATTISQLHKEVVTGLIAGAEEAVEKGLVIDPVKFSAELKKLSFLLPGGERG